MAKQLNVSLGFTADTSQAKEQLQELQNALTKLTQTSASKTSGLGLTKEINDAINAATELQVKLQQSTTSTGSLDLGKFNQSLQQGGKKLSDYANQLKALGPEGQAAFSKLARSISLAEVPLKKSNKLLSEFATTMKNTVRWQLSSSMLHGFMGAIQSAYRYSQDLNESLNNIRIVTGASIDEMDKFAEKANKAARALSATTTEYTDAALIFYQQGLNDDQVEERTNATIKMAHAAGESAEEVSSYMTAIWNNFDDGTKSLEYYGDVMTKLGAATAASSAEIAEGLEKFASIGETVGLSYEYATSAIATVVDKTRQSADTVGTAFKTIFSRLQGLQLGETLEDGTDLNKYSSALMTVGISIKDANGELKDMDVILDEMGAKWKTLHRDEQMALAQTVAGVRQYTQLMSLMNNYDDFKTNVDLAENSSGTLDEQSRIYAESWEAARDRVTAAAEQIYEALLDDKVFIGILNVVEKVVSGIGGMIDVMGGLKGVLPLVGTLMLKSFGPDIANSIDRVFYNIKLGSEQGRQEIYNLRKESADALKTMYDDGTDSGSAMVDVGTKQADLQNTLLDKTLQLQQANKELTEEEQKQAQQLLDINATLSEQYVQLTKNKEQMVEASGDLEKKAVAKMGKNVNQFDMTKGDKSYKGKSGFSEAIKEAGKLQNTYKQGQKIVKAYSKEIDRLAKANDNSSEDFENLQKRVEALNKSMDKVGDVTPEVEQAIRDLNDAAQSGNLERMQEILNELRETSDAAGAEAYEMFELIRQGAQNAGVNMKQFDPILDQIQASFEATGALTAEQIQLFTNLGFQVDEAGRIIGGFSGKVATIGDAVSATATAVSSYGMALSQASAFGENLFDPDTGPLEKLISLMMLATTVVQTYNAVSKAGKTIEEAVAAAKARKAAASAAAAAAQGVESTATSAGTVATNVNTGAIHANTAAWYSNPILAIVAVALMAVVATVSAVSSAMEANSEKIAENAEKSRDQAAASKEVFDANQDMINSYEQALKAYEEDESAKDDLISISQDLCEQLDIEGAALLRAKGDYDALTDAIYKNQKAKIDTALQDNQRAQNDTSSEFVDNMRTDTGRFSGDSYIADIGTMWQSIDDESIVSDAISNLGDEVSHITDNIAWDGTIQVKTGQSTQELRQAYEEVLAVVEEVEAIAGDDTELLNNSENYQAMLDWLDKSKDSYEALIALENEEAELRTAQIVNDAVANGQSISTLEEYEALRSQVVADLQSEVGLTEEQANSIADTYLKQSAAVSELAESYAVLQDASKVSGIAEDDLKAWYNNLDEDEQKLFATLNFDSAQSTADLDAQLEVLQARADRTSIETKLDVVEGAKDSLKKDMSADDYAQYQTESGIDWGNAEEGIMEYSEFLAMSYESQVSYLEGLSAKYSAELDDATATAIATNQERINELNGLIEEADTTLSGLDATLQNYFDAGNINLAIDEDGTMAASVEDVTNEILKLNDLDVDSEEYKELLEKLKTAGIDEATIQSYLDAHNAATAYRQEAEYLGEEIEDLTQQGEIDTIINVKTNLEGAETLGDLKAKWAAELAQAGEEGLNYTLYSEALLGLAENYDNCTTEIDEYKEALNRAGEADAQYQAAVERGDENVTQYKEALDEANESLKEHVAQLEAAVMIGEASDKYGLDAKDVETQAKMLKKLHPELNLTEEAAANLAIANQRMNKGVQKLHDNWKDWSKVLKKTDKSTGDYAEVLNDANEALADLVGVTDAATIPLDFLDSSTESGAKHLEWMEKAANGDVEAINKLGAAMGQCTVEAMEFDASMAQSAANAGLIDQAFDLTAFENYKSEVLEGITALQAQLESGTIAAGQNITSLMDGTGESWVNSLNAMAMATGMGVQEMNSLLNQLGVQAKVDVVEVPQTMKVPTYTEYVEATDPISYQVGTDPEGNPIMGSASGTRRFTVPGPSIEVEGVAQVAQISTEEGNVGAPQITYTGTGGSKTGGVSPSSTSGKGGGGGGGGAKEAKKENKKSAKDEKERYHVVENQLEDLEAQYDKIAKAKDRAFGKEKLKLMDQEIAKQKEIIAKQKEYLDQAKTNLTADKKKMDKYGAKYDKNGTITNYDSLVESQVKKYNDAVEYYNSLSAEAQEKLDKEWSKKMNEDGEYYSGYIDAAGDAYDRFQESLDQYEETQDLVRDKQQEIIDAQNELYDLQLEKIDYKVNLQIDFSDDELEHLEYLLERIEEKGFAAAEAIANLGQQTQSVMNKSDAYKEGIFSILGNHGLSDSDINAWLQGDEAATQKVAGLNLTENEVEKLREYTAGLRDNNEALIEMRQAVHDKMLETFDEWNEMIDRNIDKLDHLKSMTESYRNIVDLVGKANFAGGAETIERLNASTVKQAGNYAQANIANRDRIAEQLQATRDAYAAQKDTISEEERKMWEDTIKEMEDQLNEAEEAAMGSIEEWMEAINQQFLDSVTNTMDKFADAVAGRFANLNELSEAFERQQSVNDRYLESYEKIYEFSKLNRDIEKSIDQTDNIKAKKELADLQAEINALEESGAEVSEYQMENLRKRYELKLAELALEEAQNAKSEVRMTRDNEGNWGYVYTADETQVAEAEQSYEDKLYELQQHNAEYINQLQESIITMQQEMYDKMQEIAADESLSIEERQAKMQEVQAYYQEQMGYYYSELELVLGNNKVLYEDDWQKYSDMTGYKISSDEEYVDSFDETAYSILTGFQTMEDAQAAFNSASETMLDENLTAMDNWQTSMEDGPLKAMGSSFETLAEDIDRELGNIETESDNTTQEIEDDCDDSVDAYNGVIEAVIAWENQYSQSVDAMMDYSDNLIDKFNQVLALWADVKAAAEEAEDPPTPDDGGDDGGGNNGGGGGGGGDGKPSWDRVVAAYNKINGGKWGNGLQNRINKGKSDGFTEAEVRAGQQLINYTYPPNLNGYGYSREKAKSLMGYDTGGYTGEWGDTSGRLALLHQKELVLNQEDTANMLSAIEMIRQISSLIDLNAMSSMKGLGGMLAAGGVGQTMSGIEQHIEIHASFPDATDHSEIEEAFHNLLNSASQYANRKL